MDLKDEVTPPNLYFNRRFFLKTSIYAATAATTALAYRTFRHGPESVDENEPLAKDLSGEKTTSYQDITHYNNYYEFSTDKEAVANAAKNWRITDWTLNIDGLVETPLRLSLNDIQKIATEERIYRFRCVEGWSMVIPWLGFPLARLLEQARPTSKATHVAFETYYDPNDMPDSDSAGIALPYVEGLRLDEAMNPLALLATGLYSKSLPNQNGAPIRLVVPWKYGFKSIKSLIKITLTDKEPPTTWNLANASEYGFYSNVNPHVDHPRWSQKQERRIGELGLRPTLMFNGYENEVGKMYAGMDLKEFF